ncbi:MAG: hypothetical protein HOP17_15830 [Acidobacteria bacterium]|nr:hypothetical protein [Acidobacteriota bacterium]
MNLDLNTVLDAAMRLPLYQQKELITRLEQNGGRSPKKKTGDVRKFIGIFDSGDPRSADNDKIDADLAASYLDTHEPKN